MCRFWIGFDSSRIFFNHTLSTIDEGKPRTKKIRHRRYVFGPRSRRTSGPMLFQKSYDEASLDGRRQKVEELLSLDCCWRWWFSFLTGTMLQVRNCLGHNPVQIGIYRIYSRLTTRLLSMDSTGIMSTPSIRGTAEQLRSMVRECKEMAVKLSEF